jgi:hypothetical protein
VGTRLRAFRSATSEQQNEEEVNHLRGIRRHLLFPIHYSPLQKARVVEWQTRTFEGRMPKGMRVQVPPRARFYFLDVTL